MIEIAFLSAVELAAKIRAREISSVELLYHFATRIDRYNPEINAVIFEWRERALDEARAADKKLGSGDTLGPLHGVPMTVKESFPVTGTPNTWGDPKERDNIASADALAIQRLRQTGAIVFGKTNVPLRLADMQSYNELYGTSNNPFDLSLTPGGSSGGGAASLAAGFTGLEMGSDIGGSIRTPCHFCGVFGHKPTYNLVPLLGHALDPQIRAPADISVIGPMARSAQDLAVTLQTLAGPSGIMARGFQLALPTLDGRSLKNLRVATWSDDSTCPVTTETAQRVEDVAQACADAGADVQAVRPDFDSMHHQSTYDYLLQAEMASRRSAEEFENTMRYLESLDPAEAHPRTLASLRAQVGSHRTWKSHVEDRERIRWKWHEFFQDYDVLLAPITPTPAFKHDHRSFGERTLKVDDLEIRYGDQVFWAGIASLGYLPATAIPTGLNAQGLPIGVQIIGPEYADLITIGVASELESIGFSFTPPAHYLA